MLLLDIELLIVLLLELETGTLLLDDEELIVLLAVDESVADAVL